MTFDGAVILSHADRSLTLAAQARFARVLRLSEFHQLGPTPETVRAGDQKPRAGHGKAVAVAARRTVTSVVTLPSGATFLTRGIQSRRSSVGT